MTGITTAPLLTSDPHLATRLRYCVTRALAAFHDLVAQLDLTEAELHAVVGYLTRVGQADEFMLLSDVTHTSIFVDGLTHAAAKQGTMTNVLGPMYRPGAELCSSPGVIARIDQGDDALTLSGQVSDLLSGLPVANALVDIWQTNQAGLYDDQDPTQPPGNLRGVIRCDDGGRYSVRTVIPGPYRIASINGPVYALLNSLGRHDTRPGHLHLRASAADYQTLTTMVFVEGDPWLDDDAIGAVKPELVITPVPVAHKAYKAEFNISLIPISDP